MRNVAPVTRSPAMAMVPLTAVVRPTVSLLIPKAVSGTRKPATEPAETAQWPSRVPSGADGDAVGSASGEGAGWNLMNAQLASTTRASRATTPTRILRIQRRFRVLAGRLLAALARLISPVMTHFP